MAFCLYTLQYNFGRFRILKMVTLDGRHYNRLERLWWLFSSQIVVSRGVKTNKSDLE